MNFYKAEKVCKLLKKQIIDNAKSGGQKQRYRLLAYGYLRDVPYEKLEARTNADKYCKKGQKTFYSSLALEIACCIFEALGEEKPWIAEGFKDYEAKIHQWLRARYSCETLADFKLYRDGVSFKKLKSSDIPCTEYPRLLWHCGCYDGPLNGVCLYEGKKAWFECVDEVYFRDNDNTPMDGRAFVIVELTDKDIAEEEYWHDLFCQYVGTHANYDENNKRSLREVKPQSEHHKYYDKAKEKKQRSYSSRKVIAWYTSASVSFDGILLDAMSAGGVL